VSLSVHICACVCRVVRVGVECGRLCLVCGNMPPRAPRPPRGPREQFFVCEKLKLKFARVRCVLRVNRIIN